MRTRQEGIDFCLSLDDTYEDYPFHDFNWTVMRHKGNKKLFAAIYERMGNIWVNVKCDPILIGSLRAERGIYPAYHMSKDTWITVALDGAAAPDTIKALLDMSFHATAAKIHRK